MAVAEMMQFGRTAVLLSLLVSGCEEVGKTRSMPERYGLERTTLETGVVSDAIADANAMLAYESPERRFILDVGQAEAPHGVSVSILSSANLSSSDVIWVQQGCGCVFIQASAVRRWLDRVRLADGYGDPFAERYVVAYMLLHEMGHIVRGDDGAYLAESASGVNVTPTESKRREAAADAYARNALRRELRRGAASAELARTIITNVSVLAHNVYYAELLSQDLSEILCLAPDIYWDPGLSHPNLTFRLMEAVADLMPSPEAGRIVSSYLECRKKPAEYFDNLR